MDIFRVALGALSIFGGISALKRGVDHVNRGLKGGGPKSTTINMRGRALPQTTKVGQRKQTSMGPMRTTLKTVGSLDDRLAQIIDLAKKGKFDPVVIAWTRRELTKKCRPGWNGEQWCVPEKDTEAEIMAIFKALRRDTRYTSDILGADTYAHPRITTQLMSGDCDDSASRGCAALMSVGIPCRFKVIQTKRSSTPDHIYIQARTQRGKWISLDASVPMPPGWEAPAGAVSREWIYEV